MKLLLINSFKGLKKKKIQMFGIVVMVMLSMAVYVGMNTAIDRLETRYYDYLDEQNVEDLSIGVNIDYTSGVTKEDIDYLLEHELKNITGEERVLLDTYKNSLDNPEYNLNMFYSIKNLFQKYGANIYLETKVLDSIKDKYDFNYELERSKTVSDNKKLIKVIPYQEENNINKTYLVEGNYPTNDNEITILPGYAKANNLEIGDNYKIGDKTYKIVGYTYSPDYIYPLISFSMPIFDEENNNIVFVNENAYKNINGIIDNSYAIDYNFETKRKFEITVSTEEEGQTETTDPMMKIFDEENIIMDVNTITRIARVGALQMEFASNRLFADCFLYLLLAISVLIIVIITKKRIDDERLQIGVLKSLGYNRFSIAASYLVYPIVGSIVGGLIGYVIGIAVNYPIANILLSFYTVPLENYGIDLSYLKTAIVTPTVILSILSYIIAIIMLRKKPLDLLKEGSNLKVNFFSRIMNKLTSLLPFNYRFKYSLAFRSMGKLLIVTITSFCTGLLIVLVLIGANLFNNMIDESFSGINYKYMVMLNSFDYKESTEGENADYILSLSLPIKEIKDKDGNIKELEKEEDEELSISLTGLDLDAKYVKILDSKEKNIIPSLSEENSIILNENAKEMLGIEIDDTITFEYENIIITYKVIGFSAEYMGISGYIERSSLSEDIGLPSSAYTMVYSNDEKYENLSNLEESDASKIAYVLNTTDLKRNIEKQMDRFNGSIYIIIGFASLMTLVIIAVIANIVVEENKKTISLMKVMGYNNKRISSIVLNIYTPFIIIAYLLSIPVMINILKAIVKAIVGDIEVTIPIAISPSLALLGLIGLIVAYYIAIALSKRVLNKIPLAMALKRE